MRRHLLVLPLAAAVIAGCGSSHSQTRSTAGGEQSVALPGLGRIVFVCAGTGDVDARFDASSASATEQVTVEADAGRHLRAATVNPGNAVVTVPPARYGALTWRVIQSTEPKTLVTTVRLVFSGGGGCAHPSRHQSTRTIGHQGHWSPPDPWP
jgi:hypothetical protein